MRTYYTRRRPRNEDDLWWEIPNLDSTSRTVIEAYEEFDTGIVDEQGNRIMAREKKDPIGFIRRYE